MLWIVAIESFNLFSLSTFAFIKMHNTSQIFITFNLLIETWQIFKKICLHTAYFFRSTCSHSQLSVLSHQESWEEKCGKFCSAQWRLKTTKRKLKKLNKTEQTEKFNLKSVILAVDDHDGCLMAWKFRRLLGTSISDVIKWNLRFYLCDNKGNPINHF